MRYQVPQFIEVEDKIFEYLTFKQFVYLAGAGGFSFALFRLLPSFLALVIAIPIVSLGLALAFYKVNNKPFIFVLESGIRYFIGTKLYIWKKEKNLNKKESVQKKSSEDSKIVKVPKLSSSRLNDISWSLDINEEIEN